MQAEKAIFNRPPGPPRSGRRAQRLAVRRSGVMLLGLALACPAAARLAEQLGYAYYGVPAQKGKSLRELLNAVSPVRSAGRIYHAYTQWNVHWHYQYQQLPDGRCTIGSVETTLTATMTLPRPSDPAIATSGEFTRYLAALSRHEQGHYRIGRVTALAIDDGIFSLSSADSCAELGNAAEALANAQIAQSRETEARYDRDTGYGRTQGAVLN